MSADPTLDDAGLPIRPLPDGSDVRTATPDERPQIVEPLAEGFYDDPLFRWMFPDDERRLEENRGGFDLFARRIYFRDGEIYTTDRFAGTACWIAPGKAHVGVLDQLRLLPGMISVFRRDLPRLNAVLTAFDKAHPKDPHWYLAAIAVHPEWQGRGFGAALLRPMLQRCDAEGLPAYLEATSPRNRTLYERHGFVVRDELSVRDSPPWWPMWRDPQPDGPSSASTAGSPRRTL